jgi:uncharacterized protein YidB (DUF937 family)
MMGLLDNVLGSGVHGGNISKPLMIGLAALLASHVTRSGGLGSLFGGGGTPAPTPPVAPPTAPVAEPSEPQSGLLGGLGGMLRRFQQSGHSDVINSWIGPGQNQPIAPDQLHQALGPEAVNNLARLRVCRRTICYRSSLAFFPVWLTNSHRKVACRTKQRCPAGRPTK